MIQDIAPRKYDISYRPRNAESGDCALFYRKNSILLKGGEEPHIPRVSELEGYKGELFYLFSIDTTGFFLGGDCPDEGFIELPYRALLDYQPSWLGYAGLTGGQFFRWYQNNHYCGRCGATLTHSDKERALVCPDCGNLIYPRINPAVIIGLIHDNKIVVTKYAANPKAPHYALIAGFVETGETLEDTIRREVMEEVGLRVGSIRYYKSQPWSLSDTLLAGFYVHLDGDEEITMDSGELSVAKWMSREELDMDYYNPSLTFEMLREFSLGHQE